VARIWELPGRQLVREWATPLFQSAVFASNGTLVLASCGSSGEPPTIRHWSDLRAEDAISLRDVSSPCSVMTLTSDGKLVATGHRDGTLALWNADTGRLSFKKDHVFADGAEGREVVAVAFSANSQLLVAACYFNSTVMAWSVWDGRLLGRRTTGQMYKMTLAVSAAGDRIATAGLGQGLSVNVWDRTLQQREMILSGHQEVPYAVAFSPDGRTLASCGVDGQLKLWHLATRREVATLLAPDLGVLIGYLVFSPDGTWLGGTDTKGNLHLFHGPIPTDTASASNP
jgi:WD40 repeat protein